MDFHIIYNITLFLMKICWDIMCDQYEIKFKTQIGLKSSCRQAEVNTKQLRSLLRKSILPLWQ